MKFKFIRKVEGEVPGYGGKPIKTGDIVEYADRLAEKAARNPHFEAVQEKPKSSARS